jgi:hypothetical protein
MQNEKIFLLLYCITYSDFRMFCILLKGIFTYAVKNNAMKFSSGKKLYCEIFYGKPLLNRITYISNNIKLSVSYTQKSTFNYKIDSCVKLTHISILFLIIIHSFNTFSLISILISGDFERNISLKSSNKN